MTHLDYSNFEFERAGYGAYRVKYTTPRRGDYWVARVEYMPVIDDTKNADEPTQAAWQRLRSHVQCHGSHYSKSGERID